ncbi:MAG: hypothetical protein PHY88_00615 [Candidatus Omnitrophica bacterium]|nr:hypothetical protein [Candidatus Omnitrophota bacterium]
MVKKADRTKKRIKKMKKGAKYVCNTCGAAVIIEKPCTCGSCGISCCGESMKAVRGC